MLSRGHEAKQGLWILQKPRGASYDTEKELEQIRLSLQQEKRRLKILFLKINPPRFDDRGRFCNF